MAEITLNELKFVGSEIDQTKPMYERQLFQIQHNYIVDRYYITADPGDASGTLKVAEDTADDKQLFFFQTIPVAGAQNYHLRCLALPEFNVDMDSNKPFHVYSHKEHQGTKNIYQYWRLRNPGTTGLDGCAAPVYALQQYQDSGRVMEANGLGPLYANERIVNNQLQQWVFWPKYRLNITLDGFQKDKAVGKVDKNHFSIPVSDGSKKELTSTRYSGKNQGVEYEHTYTHVESRTATFRVSEKVDVGVGYSLTVGGGFDAKVFSGSMNQTFSFDLNYSKAWEQENTAKYSTEEKETFKFKTEPNKDCVVKVWEEISKCDREPVSLEGTIEAEILMFPAGSNPASTWRKVEDDNYLKTLVDVHLQRHPQSKFTWNREDPRRAKFSSSCSVAIT